MTSSREKNCGQPPTVDYSTVKTTGSLFGDTATYTCNTGYTLSGSPSITCESTGAWTSPHPICNGRDCGLPPKVANSNASYSSTIHTSQVKYECVSGYKMDDNDQLTCTNGKWDGVIPFCSLLGTAKLWLYLGVPLAMIAFGVAGVFTFIYCRFRQRKQIIEKLKNYNGF
ncbi:complement decay-accelerating factor-like [Tubulanus polymorphus]|uniref:complement decay-accelerating factor-like n=1 Tax=Tubulanus polymorphus TaxID=672921 RepID=UPI003DA216F0